MHFSSSALIFATALATVVSASPHGHYEPPSYQTETRCYTVLGPKYYKHGVLTSYTTTYTPCTSTVTATTTTTTTLVPVTGTVTVTDTSTVSTDSTSTVPAPATFLPVQTTLPEGTYSGSGGADPVDKRALAVNVDVNLGSDKESGGVYGAPKYPKKVTCKKWAPNKKCTKVTTTVTSTSTVTPGPSFTTVTTTSTTTVVTSATTVYAACATNNLIDSFASNSGTGISNVIPLPDGGAYPVYEQSGNTPTAYDCCVFGLLGPNPGIIFAYNINNSFCVIGANDGQCPATGQTTNTAEAIGGSATFVVGNLPCGEIISDSS